MRYPLHANHLNFEVDFLEGNCVLKRYFLTVVGIRIDVILLLQCGETRASISEKMYPIHFVFTEVPIINCIGLWYLLMFENY